VRSLARIGSGFKAPAGKLACKRWPGQIEGHESVYSLLRSLLFLLSAETAHHVSFLLLRAVMAIPLLSGLLRWWLRPSHPELRVQALGKTLSSPIGLAAGFDKDAIGYNALSDLGFGFIEVGTVTAQPQPGNPRPRLFRLPKDRAVLNRMGFNNRGAQAMKPRLQTSRRTVVGVNIGKTKVVPEHLAAEDYRRSTEALGAHADYLVVNVSSPNTPGLRDLQAVQKLRPLLEAVRQALAGLGPQRVPLFVKISPDLEDADIDAIVDLALELKLDGIVATNTTIARVGLASATPLVERCGAGGLSGAPLRERSLQVLRRLRARGGDRLVLISVGGVADADDVWERLEAGATLVQLYTSLVYGGPLLPSRLNRRLTRRLRREGLDSIQALHRRAAERQSS
jgi:dihydroorotate dehydrogenase